MRKKIKKKSGKIDFEKERAKDKNAIIAIVAIAAVVSVLVVISYELNPPRDQSYKVSAIDDITCDKTLPNGSSAEVHLDIFVDGKHTAVPGDLGIVNGTCKYWIYAGNPDGIIHIDAPGGRQVNMSQVFDIWKATSDHPPVGSPLVYVDGQKRSDSLGDTEVRSHDEIAVIYGSKPAVIPESFNYT